MVGRCTFPRYARCLRGRAVEWRQDCHRRPLCIYRDCVGVNFIGGLLASMSGILTVNFCGLLLRKAAAMCTYLSCSVGAGDLRGSDGPATRPDVG